MFKGSYANSYLGSNGFPPYTGDSEAYVEAIRRSTTWTHMATSNTVLAVPG